ncbi:unnamed protein product [Urochloa humidicola]
MESLNLFPDPILNFLNTCCYGSSKICKMKRHDGFEMGNADSIFESTSKYRQQLLAKKTQFVVAIIFHTVLLQSVCSLGEHEDLRPGSKSRPKVTRKSRRSSGGSRHKSDAAPHPCVHDFMSPFAVLPHH